MIIIRNAQFQAAVSQGLNRDSLKSLNISRFSQTNGWSLPTSELTQRRLDCRESFWGKSFKTVVLGNKPRLLNSSQPVLSFYNSNYNFLHLAF